MSLLIRPSCSCWWLWLQHSDHRNLYNMTELFIWGILIITGFYVWTHLVILTVFWLLYNLTSFRWLSCLVTFFSLGLSLTFQTWKFKIQWRLLTMTNAWRSMVETGWNVSIATKMCLQVSLERYNNNTGWPKSDFTIK